jgi:ABC-type polysaccharide/polyol phosphate export permease
MFLIILTLGKIITRTDVSYYPLYVLSGLIMFNFFRQCTATALTSINSNAGFIKSIKISSESFVISSAFQSAFSHFFEIMILVIFIIFFKIPLSGLIFYPFIFLFLFLFSLGASFILATMAVYINDIGNVWSVFVNLLWFSTPIFYILSPADFTFLNRISPMYYFIEIARNLVIYGTSPRPGLLWITIIFSAATLAAGILIFEKFKNKFAELI